MALRLEVTARDIREHLDAEEAALPNVTLTPLELRLTRTLDAMRFNNPGIVFPIWAAVMNNLDRAYRELRLRNEQAAALGQPVHTVFEYRDERNHVDAWADLVYIVRDIDA
jgi:hypothetical protein